MVAINQFYLLITFLFYLSIFSLDTTVDYDGVDDERINNNSDSSYHASGDVGSYSVDID